MSATFQPLKDCRLRVLSLGAGVQSSWLALAAAEGLIGPMPDCAIFADTGAEPRRVYEHLARLETLLPFPVHRVSVGNLRSEVLDGMSGAGRIDARPPFFTAGGGMLNRQCTERYKVKPINTKARELIGLKPRQRGPRAPVIEMWVGISTDEAIRMRPARLAFIANRYPLIEQGMTRQACEVQLLKRGIVAPKSACTFCPYRSNDEWLAMVPEDFADAVEVDRAIRPGIAGPARPQSDAWYVHPSLKPLDEVDFTARTDKRQVDLFLNECEGMCGV